MILHILINDCPYCDEVMVATPSLDENCQTCSKKIYVRNIADSRIKFLLTEEQAEEFDKQTEKRPKNKK